MFYGLRAKVLVGLGIVALCCPVSQVLGADRAPRIAVIPVADNAPPSLRAAEVAANHVETLLNRQGGLTVADSGSVAAAVRTVREHAGGADIDWKDVALELEVDVVALLSVIDARVEYLGAQDDPVASVQSEGKPDLRHYYEGKATLRLKTVDVARGETLLDEEVKGKKTESYVQSHDAAKYSEIVEAVRDVAAIFDDSIKERSGTTLTEEFAPLLLSALENASRKLAEPLEEAFPLRGTVVLVQARELTVDIGSTSGVKDRMRFEVVRPGQVVLHPKTGEEIRTGDVVIGIAKVVRVDSDTAVLEVGKKAASAVSVGDSVVARR